MPTPTATGPANLRSMPCAKLASAAGAAIGCSISDVRALFDSIDWELLLKAVRQHTDCPWVLLYVERWLKAPVQMEDGSVVPRTAGTPRGPGDFASPGEPVPALRVTDSRYREL